MSGTGFPGGAGGRSPMRQTVARKLGLDIAALTRDPASGQQLPGLVPTLFVGVGGTGAKILTRIKKRLRLGTPEEYNYASFLIVDTDPTVLLNSAPLFGPQEVAGCPFPEGEDPASALPVRARGHAAYLANYETVDRALALAYRRLTPPDWRGAAEGPKLHPERTAIVLVGSLWGVTASGMILDIAYHLGRVAISAWKAAYLLMPGAYDPLAEQEDPSMAFANAYAALSEINYVSTIDPATGFEGVLWVEGPGGEPMRYKGAPWERAYLVEGANADNVAQLYESNCAMVADALYWDTTFVLGAWKWALRDRLGYAAMRTGGGPFASFGMAALRFPRERVVAACSRRFTEQLLGRWIGSAPVPAEVSGPKAKPPRSEVDVYIETHGEWKSSGLVKRMSKLKGKGQTAVDVAITDWARPLADEAEVKKHGRNVSTVLIKEWQRMELSHFSPKAEAEGFGPRIDGNVSFRAEKYREALEEGIQDKLKYEAPGWQGLQGVMSFLEELGKKAGAYPAKYEEALPKLKKIVAERKEEVVKQGEELTKLCSNPITFPFSGAKVQAAAEAFSAAAQAHLVAHMELRATAASGRLARKLVEVCRSEFDRIASAKDMVAQARSMVRQQEDPEPVEGDVLRPEALDDLFARAFPPENPAVTKKLDAEPSPFQLASKRIAVELGADNLVALLERIREGEVLPGMLAEIAIEEGRRAFAPFAAEIDFVDQFKRTYPAPEEQALGMADTYFRSAPYIRYEQAASPAGVLVGVNGNAFTEDGYKAIGPLLQAVPLKETEVGLVPLQEGEDEGVLYYREVAGLHITSLSAVTEAQPCYEWITSQGIAGLHFSQAPIEEPAAIGSDADVGPESVGGAEAVAGAASGAEAVAGAVSGAEAVAVSGAEAVAGSVSGAEAVAGAVSEAEAVAGTWAGPDTGAEAVPETFPGHDFESPGAPASSRHHEAGETPALPGAQDVPLGVDPMEAIIAAALREDALPTAPAAVPQPGPPPLPPQAPVDLPPGVDPLEAIVAAALREDALQAEMPATQPETPIGADPMEAVVASALRENGGTHEAPIESPPATPVYEPPAMPVYEPPAMPVNESPAMPVYESPAMPAYEPPPEPALGGNLAAMQAGIDDTPFEIALDSGVLAEGETDDGSAFKFNPFS